MSVTAAMIEPVCMTAFRLIALHAMHPNTCGMTITQLAKDCLTVDVERRDDGMGKDKGLEYRSVRAHDAVTG